MGSSRTTILPMPTTWQLLVKACSRTCQPSSSGSHQGAQIDLKRRPYTHTMAESWQEQLRARGYRLTPQRQLVLEAVARLEHATPDEIVGEVRRTAHGVNISTVYRTLE